jgi:hypothetical protein
MGYYSEVVFDVYSVAKTEEERSAVETAIALTLKNTLDGFMLKLKDTNLCVNLNLSPESESILFYSDSLKYHWIEEIIVNLISKLDELCEIDIKIAYELVIVGEEYSDITTVYSSNAEQRWYVARSIERY